jgi:hypothetical protein
MSPTQTTIHPFSRSHSWAVGSVSILLGLLQQLCPAVMSVRGKRQGDLTHLLAVDWKWAGNFAPPPKGYIRLLHGVSGSNLRAKGSGGSHLNLYDITSNAVHWPIQMQRVENQTVLWQSGKVTSKEQVQQEGTVALLGNLSRTLLRVCTLLHPHASCVPRTLAIKKQRTSSLVPGIFYAKVLATSVCLKNQQASSPIVKCGQLLCR